MTLWGGDATYVKLLWPLIILIIIIGVVIIGVVDKLLNIIAFSVAYVSSKCANVLL